jgi:alkylation response protein AidB-like acyl-CoA dehydrogenase
MDFQDTPAEAEFRQGLRRYIDDHAAELVLGQSGHVGDPKQDLTEQLRATQAVLYDGGYVGVALPVEFGGRGGTQVQQAIVNQEFARARIPELINFVGIGMCLPSIIGHGSPDQNARYNARLLRADDIWCQLFSEPGSGSDLAALRTTAVQAADGSWRVNGQKIWTTHAQHARYGILLARTDAHLPKHKGLTMFVLDMRSAGVTIRPIRQMSGVSEFNEVYLDDVAIDDAERLGAVNDGWRVALTTLMNERIQVGGGGSGLGVEFDDLAKHASERLPGLPADRQVLVRQELGRVLVEALASRFTGYRRLTAIANGSVPGPEASAGKLSATSAGRAGANLAVRLLGDDAVFARSADGGWQWQTAQLTFPGLAIAGGTNEILRNIIGERVLGLPAEPAQQR